MTVITYPHIEHHDGIAYVAGTRIAVSSLFGQHRIGTQIATLEKRYPHVTRAALFAALAYGYDHPQDMAVQMRQGWSELLTRQMGGGQ